jgi:hypothetical protein
MDLGNWKITIFWMKYTRNGTDPWIWKYLDLIHAIFCSKTSVIRQFCCWPNFEWHPLIQTLDEKSLHVCNILGATRGFSMGFSMGFPRRKPQVKTDPVHDVHALLAATADPTAEEMKQPNSTMVITTDEPTIYHDVLVYHDYCITTTLP